MGISELLRYEWQAQWSVRRWLVGMLLQVLIFGSAFLLMRAAQLGKIVDTLVLAEAWTLLLAAPAFAILHVKPTHIRTPVSPLGIALVKWVGGSIQFSVFWGLALLVMLCCFGWHSIRLAAVLVKAHLMLWVLAAFASSLGLLCAASCRRRTHALQLGYLILGLLVTNVFWFSSLVRSQIGAWIPTILHLNPFVALSAILRLDLFRTPYLYEVSAITSYSYVYPAWHWTALWYGLGAVICYLMTSWRIRHLAQRL